MRRKSQEIAKHLLYMLELVRKSPLLYMGSEDPESLLVLLTGMIIAFQLCGREEILPRNDDTTQEIVAQRGWNIKRNLIDQMREAGWDDVRVMGEILDIKILGIRRRFEI